MRSGLILILGLCCCSNYLLVVYSKKCMEAEYEPHDDKTLTRKFQSEWGVLGFINRVVYRSKDDFNDLSTANKKDLCACVFFKRRQNVHPSTSIDYKTIYDQVNFAYNSYTIHMRWFCLKDYFHSTPALGCTWESEKVAVIKSFMKKSFINPQWDIYVLKVIGNAVGDFQGIIKNVDLLSTKTKSRDNE